MSFLFRDPALILAGTPIDPASPGGILIDPDTELSGPTSAYDFIYGNPTVPGDWSVGPFPISAVIEMTPDDKNLYVAAATAGDGTATGLTLTNTPAGHVQVMVRGVMASLGDATKTLDCYFSNDGGATARAISAIVAGDQLIWNGVIAGSELFPSDRIDFCYMAAP